MRFWLTQPWHLLAQICHAANDGPWLIAQAGLQLHPLFSGELSLSQF